ncbi:hypothetical protein M0D69_34930 [Caballeronia sp. SEWSISQ10-4 2]|uniref:hypothetical protein n=1 Tax=Caballeronia sp. SEWSISQ10-4 2 TaxID=2937438 RepID=UPI00264D41EE|nr:hypothetical protein [Caballeronia sp. SEWSISQ10-4 2]MDN7183118.1 hypothetical protein [Caballeronia sp. SEWSISQ10-4 2]
MSTSRVAAFSRPLRLMAATAFAAGPFDGVWAVTLTCPSTDDGVYGYVFRFDAQVTDNVLHGERGSRDTGGWMTLDGRIDDSGHARLEARGLTGAPVYSVGQVKSLTPYIYIVDAQFDSANGSGHRI